MMLCPYDKTHLNLFSDALAKIVQSLRLTDIARIGAIVIHY